MQFVGREGSELPGLYAQVGDSAIVSVSSGVVRLTQPQVVRASSGGMGGTALAEVATSTSAARNADHPSNGVLFPRRNTARDSVWQARKLTRCRFRRVDRGACR